MELLLDDQKTWGGLKGLYTFLSTYADAGPTERMEKEHTTEEPKEEKPSLDHIRATQNWTQLTRGGSALLSERPTQTWTISLTLGALGLYRLDIVAIMMVSRVATVGVDATLSSCSYTVDLVRG